MEVARRSFLTGFGSFVAAAPAIVKTASLMPVRSYPDWLLFKKGEVFGVDHHTMKFGPFDYNNGRVSGVLMWDGTVIQIKPRIIRPGDKLVVDFDGQTLELW